MSWGEVCGLGCRRSYLGIDPEATVEDTCSDAIMAGDTSLVYYDWVT